MNYIVALRYFLIMAIMLLFTGIWIFMLHTSLSIDGTRDYYALKSFFGLLETVSPHLFGMSLLIFILTHFFAIIKDAKKKKDHTLFTLFFIVMLLANISGFFIEESDIFYTKIKLTSTLVFVAYSFFIIYKLFKISAN